ncbi:hypothetical protein BH10PSE14_BH10PSE14_21490 [soil metagenome]
MPSFVTSASIGDLLLRSRRDESVVSRTLNAVRTHLGLQIAYVSQIIGNESIFREVDAPGLEHLIKPGDRRSLDDVYCRHILEGRLPELMPDTSAFPLAVSMPVTSATPIGAHVSVPLRLADGQLYGMFCCLGPTADPSLNERDLSMMRAFAELAAFEIGQNLTAERDFDAKAARIGAILSSNAVDIAYQPIWHIVEGRPIGFESLARFDAAPVRTPDLWFSEAAEVGRGVELEVMAIRHALRALPFLPTNTYIAVNASPLGAESAMLREALASFPLDRIVLEITEHQKVDDFGTLVPALAPMRAQGLRIAVDDAGAGYSGLQQILEIEPDVIKLDRFLIQGIGEDSGKRALAGALLAFARETGSTLVAEGVETQEELEMLRALGVHTAQGYFLGRPQSLDSVLDGIRGRTAARG